MLKMAGDGADHHRFQIMNLDGKFPQIYDSIVKIALTAILFSVN
jgi:hypothetical protein